MRLPRKTKKLFRPTAVRGGFTIHVMLCPLPGATRAQRRRYERFLAHTWRRLREASR